MLLVPLGIYGAAISALVLLLRRAGVPGGRAILLSLLIFGAVTGMLTTWAWPLEASIYFNLPATLLGDRVYDLSIRYLGDSGSPQAHYTIPWMLRVPQVYALVAVALSALVGLPLQWLYNRRRSRL